MDEYYAVNESGELRGPFTTYEEANRFADYMGEFVVKRVSE